MSHATIVISSNRETRLTVSSSAAGYIRPVSGSMYVFTLVDPERPLAHRIDLPDHEREISGEAYAMLRSGLAAAEGAVPRSIQLPDEEEE